MQLANRGLDSMACRTPWHFRAAGMSGLFSASPVNVQEAHGYMRAIQQCSTDLYRTAVTSSYCVSYRRLAINTRITAWLAKGRSGRLRSHIVAPFTACVYWSAGHQSSDLYQVLREQVQVFASSYVVAKRPRDASCLSVVSFNSTKRRAESSIVR